MCFGSSILCLLFDQHFCNWWQHDEINESKVHKRSKSTFVQILQQSFILSFYNGKEADPCLHYQSTANLQGQPPQAAYASFVMEWSTKMTQRPVFLRFSQWKSHQCSLPSRVSLHGSRGCYCKWSCAAEKLCELGRLTDFSRIYPHPILLWYRLIKKIKKNTFAICSTCFVDWFVADLIAGWLACLLAWLFDWLIAWLLGWLIDGWLAGWPAGTAVSCLDFSR